MTPAEWWLVFDANRADREKLDKRLPLKRKKELLEFAKKDPAKLIDKNLRRIAEGAEPRKT